MLTLTGNVSGGLRTQELPEPLKALCSDRIASVDQLRVLLLLRRQRGRAWSAPAVGKRLGLAPSVAADGLDYLCRANLVDVKVGAQALLFRYGPGTDHLDRSIGLLERLYDERRSDVVALLDAGGASASRFK